MFSHTFNTLNALILECDKVLYLVSFGQDLEINGLNYSIFWQMKVGIQKL